MLEKVIRLGICHTIHRYAKTNNKYMKDYHKNKESSHLKHWDVNNLHRWEMSQRLPVNYLKWVADISVFDLGFMENYNEESDEKIFWNWTFNILKNYRSFKMTYHFYLK